MTFAGASLAGEQVTAGPTGTLVRPGDESWDQARTPWLTNLPHQPVAVALVISADDVAATVRSAAAAGLGILAEGTGHGAAAVGALTDAVLIRTSALNTIDVDPDTDTAWVGAGADWGQVSEAAAVHGLTAQAGSAADVGVAGFLLSGGISWLSRSRGLAVNDVLAVELVDPRGGIHIVDAESNADLFWAVRGGGGGFGVVTRFRLQLHRIQSIVAGTLFYPMSRGREVLHAWRSWTDTLSDQTMSCGRLLQLPPLPELPERLRGQALVAVEVAHQREPAELNQILTPLRDLGPVIDTISRIAPPQLVKLHMDPPCPTPATGDGTLLVDLPPSAIDAVLACAGHGTASPLLSLEFRHLGGAVARRPLHAGAVGHFDGSHLMFAVGVTPNAAATSRVAARVAAVVQTLSPWAAEIQYANFVEQPCARQRFHDVDTLNRLQQIKHTIDPDIVVRSGHPLPVTSADKQHQAVRGHHQIRCEPSSAQQQMPPSK